MTPEQCEQYLDGAAERLENASLRDAMEQCLAAIHDGIEATFAAKVDSAGAAWPPRKDNLPHPLLDKTGKMKRAAITGGSADDRELVATVADVPYATYHQTGTKRMPKREFHYVTEDTLDACEQIIADEALKAIFPD
jgi:phage gpG-like protein